MAVALSVNLNKIALLRNSREGNYPDPVEFGKICLANGADGLTVHPRPDQRHIRPDDVARLGDLVRDIDDIEFNIEGNPFAEDLGDYPGFIPLVEQHKPDQCTLVPDSNEQLTSDHGFDLRQSGDKLAPLIAKLKSRDIRVSLFMDPDVEQIKLAKQVGADRIELYTGPYAWAFKQQSADLEDIFQAHCRAAETALEVGLGINAGHDLNLQNLDKYCGVPGLQEVSIGHGLTVESLTMGMAHVVSRYRDICQGEAS
ncbi:pyridoxine 5'-phosphate synthase [Pseudoteredinibacter isoporae]|uniref:Pyridoxine 5'-phosphate synthase n=1 Tax=Pseudoteredinibacter isoporae TaxID=570281 RepID=A0A7X0MXJ2_9GAMM|nr:pyridoxine 5'-phosphate synthase [Pseudoteredinibacter isoporae]MBB6522049.1 pyridoxine 5-phosphate synthase [Pseudoteredinibacter isoporae]